MPAFVPVTDVEKPKSEQNIHGKAFSQHRQFDNPYAIPSNKPKPAEIKRGWEQGNVGWGVLGSFGSNTKDDGAQVARRAQGKEKMVKNEQGLWVKAKEIIEKEDPASSTRGKSGGGRGGGVSVMAAFDADYGSSSSSSKRNNFEAKQLSRREAVDRGYHDDISASSRGSHSHRHRDEGSQNRSRSRSRSDSRRRSRQDNDRGRTGDRKRDSRDRQTRSRSRSRSRPVDDRDKRKQRQRSRSDSRNRKHRSHQGDRDGKYNDIGKRKDVTVPGQVTVEDIPHRNDRAMSTSKSTTSNIDSSKAVGNSADKNVDIMDTTKVETELLELDVDEALLRSQINAVQVVNRFLEIFSDTNLATDSRLSKIAELFHTEARVSSLKSGKDLIQGAASICNSFAKTIACPCPVSYRMFIDDNSNDSNAASTTEEGEGAVTYCFDMHAKGSTPGLGDRSRDGLLLYKCSEAVIQQVWGMPDTEGLGSKPRVSKREVCDSQAWKLVLATIERDRSRPLKVDGISTCVHFNDYNDIATWG